MHPPEQSPYEPDPIVQKAIEANNRFMEKVEEVEAARQASLPQKTPPEFTIPVKVQAQLERRKEIHDAEAERLDSQAIFNNPQIERRIAETVLKPGSSKKHANQIHQNRPSHSKVLRRPRGSIQRDIADSDRRVEDKYGKPGEGSY